MKPFDLQKALAGEPVVTRDGRPVKIAGYNEDAIEEQQVIGWVDNEHESWGKLGNYYLSGYTEDDLFMASTKKEGWVNLYRCAEGQLHSVGVYDSEKEAKIAGRKGLITTIRIEWEE